MQNVFSEKCCFSWTICLLQEHKIFSGENLAHLKTSNTKVDMRGRCKKRTQAVYRLLSCVQYLSRSCLIICCCKAEDTNGVLQQFMELHLYEQKEEKHQTAKAAAEKQDGCTGLREEVFVINWAKERNDEGIYICKNKNIGMTTGAIAGMSKEKGSLCREKGLKCFLLNFTICLQS